MVIRKPMLIILFCLFLSACASTTRQPVSSGPIDPKFWVDFQKEWTGLDPENYRVYVIHNIYEFRVAPEDIKRQGIEKWQAFYPQDPWPPDNPPKKHSAGTYISDKQLKEEAMIIIPAILNGIITNNLY